VSEQQSLSSDEKLMPVERSEEEHRRYQELFELIPEGCLVTDCAGRILEANQSAVLLLRQGQEALIGQSFATFLAQQERPGFRARLAELPGGSIERLDNWLVTLRPRGGKSILVTLTAQIRRDPSGQCIGYRWLLREATGGQLAEEALRNAAQQWRTTFDAIRDMVCLLDAHGRVVRCNSAMAEFLGESFQEIIGRSCCQIVCGRLGMSPDCCFARVRASGRRESSVALLGNRWFSVTVDPMLNPAGDFVGAVHIMTDVTERKQAEAQASEIEILRELDRLRSELIANVSHELRTPLGLIKIFCTTLLRTDVDFDPQTQREFLHDIEEETERLEKIVDNLLDLSRIQHGRLRLEKRPTDLGQLARQVLDDLEMQLPASHRLIHSFPAEPLVAPVEPRRIEQVLRNLVSNAIKYSPQGGTITVMGQEAGEMILIQVRDQGIGIPHEDLERVFERFYRVENEITRSVRGIGLGLAVCRGIVEAHGGRIWVESLPGEGSTFYFTLPAGGVVESPLDWAEG